MLGPFEIEEKGRVALMPFLDLVMVWNRGVSYGLFTQDGDLGRWFLVRSASSAPRSSPGGLGRRAACLPRSRSASSSGARVSNVIDRLVYGAVADFFLFHVGDFEWYVFNLADVWIVAGAVGLVLAWALSAPKSPRNRENRRRGPPLGRRGRARGRFVL